MRINSSRRAAIGPDPTAGSLAGKFFLVSCNPSGMWNDPRRTC